MCVYVLLVYQFLIFNQRGEKSPFLNSLSNRIHTESKYNPEAGDQKVVFDMCLARLAENLDHFFLCLHLSLKPTN